MRFARFQGEQGGRISGVVDRSKVTDSSRFWRIPGLGRLSLLECSTTHRVSILRFPSSLSEEGSYRESPKRECPMSRLQEYGSHFGDPLRFHAGYTQKAQAISPRFAVISSSRFCLETRVGRAAVRARGYPRESSNHRHQSRSPVL